jgi:hypothetical protein
VEPTITDPITQVSGSASRVHSRLSQHAEQVFDLNPASYCATCYLLITLGMNEWQLCSCDHYDYYTGKRWLGIPCFNEEETEAYPRTDFICHMLKSCEGKKCLLIVSVSTLIVLGWSLT